MESYKDLYPEGYYRVRVIGNAVTTSKSTNSQYIVLKVEVLEKTDKAKAEIIPGGHRYVNLWTSDKCIKDTGEFLEAAGFIAGEHVAEQLDIDHPDHLDLSGFEFSARCQHEEYNGDVKDKFGLARSWSLTRESTYDPTAWAENMPKANRVQMANLDALLGAAKKPVAWTPQSVAATQPASSNRQRVPF